MSERSSDDARRPVADFVGYLTLATLSLSLVALVEALFVAVVVPYASAAGAGLLRLWLNLFAYHALCAVPLAVLFAWLEPRLARLPRPRTSDLLAGLAYVWLCAHAIARVDLWLDNIRPDFADALAEIERTWTLAFLVLGLVAALVVARALGWLLVRAPRLDVPHVVLGVAGLALAFRAVWLAYHGLSPIHLGRAVLGPALAANALALLAVRLLGSLPASTASRHVGAASLVLGTVLGVTFADGPHTRFLVHNHASLAGALAARLRDVLDFDRDGSAPSWALGNDCAPFDPRVAPLEREVAGDGIDQDCTGADAQAPSVVKPPARRLCASVPEQLSILLVTVDSLRADTLSAGAAPNLLQLAQRSLHYSRAYAAGSMTMYATASMVTGLPLAALTHNAYREPRFELPRPIGLMMRDGGLRTMLLDFGVIPNAMAAGFNDRNPGSRDVFEDVLLLNFTSATISDGLRGWIERQEDARFFAWAHLADPHAPYRNPETQFLEPGAQTYLREVGYTDYHLGRLFEWLFASGRGDRTAIVVTADHGESLGEYGHEGHGVEGYEGTIHVPLLIYVPGCAPARVDTPVSLVKLAATIADLASVSDARPSLLDAPAGEPVVSEIYSADLVFDEKRFARSLVVGNLKLIHDVRNGGSVLFDLGTEDREARDLFAAGTPATDGMMQHYRTWLDGLAAAR